MPFFALAFAFILPSFMYAPSKETLALSTSIVEGFILKMKKELWSPVRIAITLSVMSGDSHTVCLCYISVPIHCLQDC